MKIVERDLKHIWHPCSQMKDYETFKPIVIDKAKGPFLFLTNGQKVIDAISSWWCKPLGHNHARLQKALRTQLKQYEHVIGANTCQKPLVLLSEKLSSLTKTLNKVFYASEGSSAVEIALKMSLHARYIKQEKNKTKFMALKNSYHGETLLALSVSDLPLYRAPYEHFCSKVSFLNPIPYVLSKQDPLFENCGSIWPIIEKQLLPVTAHLSAIILEPIIQGAGGMLLYSKDFLQRLSQFCKKQDIHLIADEIMTGLNRTGLTLACHHADIEPDFLLLGKGLTNGILPMSAVLTHNAIYELFYDDYDKGKSFLHSHTFSGNALSAAVALECLTVLEKENIFERTQELELLLRENMQFVAEKTKRLTNIRGIGGIIAADLILPSEKQQKRIGFEIFQQALQEGAFLRPLGNTLYWFPPLNIAPKTLRALRDITLRSIQKVQA